MPERPWSERLREFVDRWYERPLGPEDGNSADEVQKAEKALGRRLPAALVDWYRLVGRRLGPVQDSPVLLGELAQLRRTPDRVPIWIENQSVWIIEAPLDGDDPPVTLRQPDPAWAGGPLSEVLLAMLTSDTLFGAPDGALGPLHERVTAGSLQDPSADVNDRVRRTLAVMSSPRHPSLEEPPRGHEDLVVQDIGDCWAWMACTDEAFRQACSLLEIDPDQGPYEVVLRLTDLSTDELRSLGAHDLGAAIARFRDRVGQLGHVGSAGTLRRGTMEFRVTTGDPGALFDRVRHAFPAALDAKLVIAYRPEAIARFTALHPPGLGRWYPRR